MALVRCRLSQVGQPDVIGGIVGTVTDSSIHIYAKGLALLDNFLWHCSLACQLLPISLFEGMPIVWKVFKDVK